MPSVLAETREAVAALRDTLMTIPTPEEILSHAPVLAAHLARLAGSITADGETLGAAIPVTKPELRALKSELNMAENLIGNALGFYSKWSRMLGVELGGYDHTGNPRPVSARPAVSINA